MRYIYAKRAHAKQNALREHKFLWLVLAFFIWLELAGSGIACAADYTLTILAKTGDAIGGQTLTSVGSPVINNRGTVVFFGSFSGGSGIFTPSDLLVRTGDTIDGQTLTGLVNGQLTINDSGEVPFAAGFSDGGGIFTPSSLVAKTGNTIGGQTLFGVVSPVINDRGTIAFIGTFPGGSGIFTPSSLVAKTGDAIDGKTLLVVVEPQINTARSCFGRYSPMVRRGLF